MGLYKNIIKLKVDNYVCNKFCMDILFQIKCKLVLICEEKCVLNWLKLILDMLIKKWR